MANKFTLLVTILALTTACRAPEIAEWEVDKLTLHAPAAASVQAGQALQVAVFSRAPVPRVAVLSAPELPTGAVLSDRGDGSALFYWTPASDQVGVHDIVLAAQTQDERVQTGWKITVTSAPTREPSEDDEKTPDEDPDDGNSGGGGGDPVNTPPHLGLAWITPGTYRTGDDVQVEALGWFDAENTAPTYVYRWYVNGVTLDADGPVLDGALLRKGDVVLAEVIPFDGELTGATVTSNSIFITNTPPETPHVHLSPIGITWGTESLSASIAAPATDADDDTLSYDFHWYLNDDFFAEGLTVSVQNALRHGDMLRLIVNVTDGEDSVSTDTEIKVDMRLLRSVAAGQSHTCAVHNDGLLFCWGSNNKGQLGLGSGVTAKLTPTLVPLAQPAVAVAAGDNHTCAVLDDGTVACWGQNNSGEAGSDAGGTVYQPSLVTGLADVTAVSAGTRHTCALDKRGKARCWGENGYGQLGDGAGGFSSQPVTVHGNRSFTDISSGAQHTCAVETSGLIYCWGYNLHGQLGIDSLQPAFSPWPLQVTALTDAVGVTAGGNHSCALRQTGEARCWGDDSNGQLGNDTMFTSFARPVALAGSHAFSAIAAGSSHTCALSADGSLYCWGKNAGGQLGSTPGADQAEPVYVDGPGGNSSIASGSGHSCLLTRGGAIRCWGDNANGQLGDGSIDSTTGLVSPLGFPEVGVRNVAAGHLHTCAVTAQGTLKCWGYGEEGQLGTGAYYLDYESPKWDELDPQSMNGQLMPVWRGVPYPQTVPGVQAVEQLSASISNTCAVSEQKLYCWGSDDYGALGDGLPIGGGAAADVNLRYATYRASPSLVPFFSDPSLRPVSFISVGIEAVCANLASGGSDRLYCWGWNYRARLGQPENIATLNEPTLVTLAPFSRYPTIGHSHACAIVYSNRKIHCWGWNRDGQLGINDDTINTLTTIEPVVLSNDTQLEDVATIEAGPFHTCARAADKTVYCWGNVADLPLSGGYRYDVFAATPYFSDADSLDVGGNSCYTADGEMYCWGIFPVGNGVNGGTSVATSPSLAGYRVTDMAVSDALSPNHACAVTDQGSLLCWGDNSYGQLGDGTYEARLTPIEVMNSAYWW